MYCKRFSDVLFLFRAASHAKDVRMGSSHGEVARGVVGLQSGTPTAQQPTILFQRIFRQLPWRSDMTQPITLNYQSAARSHASRILAFLFGL